MNPTFDWYGNVVPVGSFLSDDGFGSQTLKHPDGTVIIGPTYAQQASLPMPMKPPTWMPTMQHDLDWSSITGKDLIKNIHEAMEKIHDLAGKTKQFTEAIDSLPKPHHVTNEAESTISPCTCSAGTDHDAGQEDFDGDYPDEFDPETMA